MTLTSGYWNTQYWGNPPIIGYANVTYRFFKWGWITETKTTVTYNLRYGEKQGGSIYGYRFDIGLHLGNNWRFVRQLDEGLYKNASGNYTMMPYTQIYDIGKSYWFTIYDSSTGRAAGIVDLIVPTITGTNPTEWRYIINGTDSPEQWRRDWPSLRLQNGNYVLEKYAFYIWNAAGGVLSPFTDFANGVSAIQRQQYPLGITVSGEEYIHYTVNVHVTDYDGSNLANANITVNSTTPFSKITNATGWATFYLEPGTYNFSAIWNGNTSYEVYTNYTISTINTHKNIDLVFNNITTLLCRTQYTPSENPIQNAIVNLYKTGTAFPIDSAHVNLTGWVEFHINRSSWFGNYDVKAYYDNGTSIGEYSNQNISAKTILFFNVTLGPAQKYTYIEVTNGTSIGVDWGNDVILKVYWRDSDGNNLSTLDPSVGGTLNWTLNFINGTFVTQLANVTPSGSGSDVYYIVNLSSLWLFGGEIYQVYINATADNSAYLPAANQTMVSIYAAEFNVQITEFAGPYYWKHSDIPIWVYVTNDATGEPVSSAIVSFTILGTSVSGQLVHSGSGNYTYTIPKSVVESSLAAITYGLRFNISSINYTDYSEITQLTITPAKTEFLYASLFICTYGDTVYISVIYRDKVDGTPISTGTVSYSVVNQQVGGYLNPDPYSGGNWTGGFNSTLLYPSYYVLRLTAYSDNYEGHSEVVPLVIQPITMEIKAEDVISKRVNDELLISVQLNDTYNGELVHNATVWYTVKTSNGTIIVYSTPLIDLLDNGTYSASLSLLPSLTPPGNYRIEISAVKENYTASTKVIQLIVEGIPTAISFSIFYISSLNNPETFFFSNFGQVENSMPFVLIVFRFSDSTGSTISNASVSASGLPLLSLGYGSYAVILPTYGLPPSTYPILINGEAYLYESKQSLFLLQVKEKTVLIPLFNIRIPLTMFLAIVLAVAIPTIAFSTYTYIKRVRIPAIIKRIDELIKAISRGEKVTVKLVPRDAVIGNILREELAIVGVEPKVEKYIPVELADLIVPLLVESGMKEKEAYAMALELKTAAPAQREKLLESVGIPGETSARIIQTIEEHEEKQAVIRKPSREETPGEEEEWERVAEEEESEKGEREDSESEDN
ncbi:MAG: hypothetical protein QXO71_01650 [Candidatus Jordarchaeaceae archaeon]